MGESHTDAKSVRVKICGITTPEDVRILNQTKPDYAGFVFFEKSKRFVTIPQAKTLMAALDPGIKRVAVCVDPAAGTAQDLAEAGFDILQVHGKVPADLPADYPLPLWQAIHMTGGVPGIPAPKEYMPQAFLVDSSTYGSGQTFDWTGCKGWIDAFMTRMRRETEKPVLFALAGGLRPDNVREGIAKLSPDIVDVSSGVEYTDQKGKDPEKVWIFIQNVRNTAVF